MAYQVVSILSQKLDDKQFAEARFEITSPQLIVFAGEHDVAAQDISIALREVTGQMVGTMQKAVKLQMILLIDGFIGAVAARIVCALSPNAQQYMIFAHCSGETKPSMRI